MSWLERIGQLVGGSSQDKAIHALSLAYQEEVIRAGRLARHAEASPQETSRHNLMAIAALADQQAEALAAALRAAGAPIPPTPRQAVRLAAPSHWARLVADLESYRDAVIRYRELIAELDPETPATASVFGTLTRHCEQQCRELRTLIARADPQASD